MLRAITSDDYALLEAVHDGDEQKCAQLLRQGVSAETVFHDLKQDLLGFAVRLNRPAIVRVLLANLRKDYFINDHIQGAVDLTFNNHRAALEMMRPLDHLEDYMAEPRKYSIDTTEVLALLLARPRGRRPRIPACEPDFDITRAHSPNDIRQYGVPPLCPELVERAIRRRHPGMLKMLFDAGCDPGRTEALVCLLDHVAINGSYCSCKDWGEFVRTSCRMLRVVLQHSTKPHRTKRDADTPLHKLVRMREHKSCWCNDNSKQHPEYIALLDKIATKLIKYGESPHDAILLEHREVTVFRSFCKWFPEQDHSTCKHGPCPKWLLDCYTWSPVTHRNMTRERRRAIHTVMVLWHSQATEFAPLAVELLFVVFEMLCAQ